MGIYDVVVYLCATALRRVTWLVSGGAQGSRCLGSQAEGGSIVKKGSNPKKVSAFDKLSAGLEDAIAYQRGRRALTAREVEFRPLPKLGAREVARVRAHLRVSQVAFARLLNVSPRTVQAWESNARTPSDAALKLLHVARRHPEVLIEP
jgi:putative transcriptional regulator